VYLTGLGVMLGIFITVISLMFSNMTTGFKDAKLERESGFKEAKIERDELKLSQARITTLLELNLIQKGFSFEDIDRMVEERQSKLKPKETK
jgi:hypothetical protein